MVEARGPATARELDYARSRISALRYHIPGGQLWGIVDLVVREEGASEFPIVVRAVGILAIVCAVALPVFGPRLVEWWAGQGPDVIRLTSLIKIVAGAAIAFSANP